MARVYEFPHSSTPKPTLRRAGRRRPTAEDLGQLDLFSSPGRVLELPLQMGAYEAAALAHERGDQERARLLYRQAIDEGEAEIESCTNLGVLEAERGNTVKAFTFLASALSRDPSYGPAHYNLASLYVDVGELRLAQLHFEICREIDPTDSDVHYSLGVVYAMEQDYSAAVDALTTFQELAPGEERGRADEPLSSLRREMALEAAGATPSDT